MEKQENSEAPIKSILRKPGEKKEKKSGGIVINEEQAKGHDANDEHHRKFVEKSSIIEGHEGLLVRKKSLSSIIQSPNSPRGQSQEQKK